MGCDFLCLSDHLLPEYGFPITDTRGARAAGFTTILGAEIHAPANSHGELWHVLACGLPPDFAPPGEGEAMEALAALAARAKAAGAFVGIAHPQWSSLTIEDGRAMSSHVHAVEIYNHTSALETARPDGTALLDALLSEGHGHLTGYAADDAHGRIGDRGGGWMMVRARADEPGALLAAMKAGRFYSSQGPELHAVELDRGTLRVAASPVRCVALVGRGSRAVSRFEAFGLTAAELSVEPFRGDRCRVVASDARGRQALVEPDSPPVLTQGSVVPRARGDPRGGPVRAQELAPTRSIPFALSGKRRCPRAPASPAAGAAQAPPSIRDGWNVAPLRSSRAVRRGWHPAPSPTSPAAPSPGCHAERP